MQEEKKNFFSIIITLKEGRSIDTDIEESEYEFFVEFLTIPEQFSTDFIEIKLKNETPFFKSIRKSIILHRSEILKVEFFFHEKRTPF